MGTPAPTGRMDDWRFELPPSAIAQHPAQRREDARLLVVGQGTEHRRIADLPQLLQPGDLLVVNDTRVRPARLFAHKATGGRVELLLVHPTVDGWAAYVRPSKKVPPGTELRLTRRGDGAEGPPIIVGEPLDGGLRAVRGELSEVILAQWGELPLPPYIPRPEGPSAEDRERYQTVWARETGAVAAPTAGLHFSEPLLARLAERGIQRASVTLHVGPGTFQPVRVDRLADHQMHVETYRVPTETAAAVAACEQRGGRLLCVGTTSLRALESWHRAGRPGDGWRDTDLFVHPADPPRLRVSLLTNFHLPGSTLLVLVGSLLGRQRTLDLYRDAVQSGYRFYSYGDAMLLL